MTVEEKRPSDLVDSEAARSLRESYTRLVRERHEDPTPPECPVAIAGRPFPGRIPDESD
jgi:hypothetical protein